MAGITSAVAGKLVAIDTAPFIYYLEEHPDYLSLTDDLFGAIERREAVGMTSVLTLLELMVKPLREGENGLADSYRDILTNAANLSLYGIDEGVSVRAAHYAPSTRGCVRPTRFNWRRHSRTARTSS